MRFQSKLLLVYMTISVLVIGIVSISLFAYGASIIEENTKNNLQETAEGMIRQLDDHITWADYTMSKLVEDEDFKAAMTLFQKQQDNEITISKDSSEMNEAHQYLRSLLFRDSINQHFHRVSVFNMFGDYYTSSYERMDNIDIKSRVNSLTWLSEADDSLGNVKNRILVPTFLDTWEETPKTKVFSIARHIPSSNPKYGGKAGYIEIQIAYSELENIFNINENEGQSILAVVGDGQYLYDKNIEPEKHSFYLDNIKAGEKEVKSPYSGDKEFLITVSSEYSSIRIILVQDRKTLLNSLSSISRFTVFVTSIALLIAVILTSVLSKKLTAPLRNLKISMEEMDINNLKEHNKFSQSGAKVSVSNKDEIQALNIAFIQLRNRLIISMKNELKAQALQMTANFDSLQAQINPHFLYNILNVLSSKGIEMDDMEICEICDGIASMLRYTTTKDFTTTINDETEHVRNYLNLLKKRFESDLVYDVDISSELAKTKLPKLVLQPLVENSINHGYQKINRNGMYVCIIGQKTETGCSFTIFDNGQGFDLEILDRLKSELKSVENKLKDQTESLSFSIGGMGIVNTFSRLWLFFNGNVDFEIGNLPLKGAYVKISIYEL